jgi:hypothetical protein
MGTYMLGMFNNVLTMPLFFEAALIF